MSSDATKENVPNIKTGIFFNINVVSDDADRDFHVLSTPYSEYFCYCIYHLNMMK